MAHGRARAPERRVAFALGSAKVAFASNAKLGRSGVLLRRLRPAALLARPAHQGRQRGPLGRPPKGDHVTPLLLMAPLSLRVGHRPIAEWSRSRSSWFARHVGLHPGSHSAGWKLSAGRNRPTKCPLACWTGGNKRKLCKFDGIAGNAIEPGNARNAVQVQPDLVDCSDGHHRLAFGERVVDDFGELGAQDRVEIADLISLWQFGSYVGKLCRHIYGIGGSGNAQALNAVPLEACYGDAVLLCDRLQCAARDHVPVELANVVMATDKTVRPKVNSI